MIKAAFLILIILSVTGCSMTLHERKKDENNPSDLGTKTEFNIKGPKAEISHKF